MTELTNPTHLDLILVLQLTRNDSMSSCKAFRVFGLTACSAAFAAVDLFTVI